MKTRMSRRMKAHGPPTSATPARRRGPSRIAEPIAVPTMHNQFFPKAFVWRGRRHVVSAGEDCRTEVRRDWRGLAERQHIRVRSEGAVFELTQDLARDTWQLERMWER
jgi:hypothetical protein